ncbi:hypothetical protein [Henriciella sp.]|uniref:hypothetical protein n=1 Tax=Henriciella sp. TaxID=1968823 RepID=UPI00261296D8|nr:hypothetical protein [Henriciella sp.]
MITLIARYWQLLAGAGAVLACVIVFNVWLSKAKSAAYTRGFETAASDCRKAREAAQRARDAQIDAIRKQEAAKRADLQARLDARNERNRALDDEIAAANQAAERARKEAERLANEDLANDGLAGCKPTPGVSDGYRDDLSAYRARHGH